MHGLLTLNREEALEEYHTFTFTDAEENSKFEAYCSPKKKVTYEHHLSLKAKSFCVE